MWWGKGDSDKDFKASPASPASPAAVAKQTPATAADAQHERYDKSTPNNRGTFDSTLPDRQKLPPGLQKIVDKQDKEDNFFDELVDG